ncbi:caspase, EACC1-associated type [Streptomyces antimycoticus]
MAGLPDPAASRAVLIGVSSYQKMEPLPAVAGNLRRLRTLLTEPDLWGLSPRHCTVLSNPRSTETVLDAVHAAAAEAEDALLVYFAGHGLVSLKGDLYLALPSSHAERIYSGVSYDLLRSQLVDEATARSRVVILDCCYGGRALDGYMGSGARAAATTGSAGSVDVADSVAVEGTYVMTAAAATKQALAPPGEKYTAFTGELLQALEKGVPNGPDPLSMDAIFQHLRRELAAKDRPRPQQRARNGGTSIALVRNRWAVAEARRRAEEARRAAEDARRAAAEEVRRAAEAEARSGRATEARARSLLAAPEPTPGGGKRARWQWNAPRPLRLRRPGRVVLALSLVAGLLGGGTYLYVRDTEECATGGVAKVDSECVGVTDGRYVFTEGTYEVSRRIKNENDRVLHSGAPSVAIALMTSMTASDSEEQRRIQHKLDGALLAQQRVNGAAGKGPKVRLLLANHGREGAHWARVAAQLEDLTKVSSPLRAVIGLDADTARTNKVISRLAARGIPVVSASTAPGPAVTGDNAPTGVARVMADLDDQQRALVNTFADLDSQRSVLVSEDNPSDLYVKSLRSGFQQIVKASPFPPQTYPPSENGEQDRTREEAIADIAGEVCRQTPEIETVLFAGRAESLRHFLNSLARSLSCARKDLTVISGSDAGRLTVDPRLDREGLRGPVKVRMQYATAFHPDAWQGPSAPKTGGSREALETLLHTAENRDGMSLSDDDIMDGTLVATYDAALTAVAGIQGAYREGQKLPDLAEVAANWSRLTGGRKVEGASGWICLDLSGHPYNKAVAVAQLDFVGRHPKLLTVAWPERRPPSKSCATPGA